MPREKLIASSVAISCCLAVVIFAAWILPRKGAPSLAQSTPQSSAAGVVSADAHDGPLGGATAGRSGGINNAAANRQQANEPDLDYSTIWIDTVRRGPMLRQVRGLGTLVHADKYSSNFIAKVSLPQETAKLVQINQVASVATRKGIVKGRVSGISAEIANGMGSAEIVLAASPEIGFTVGHQIDVTIDIEKLENILQVGRPVHVFPDAHASLFKVINDGKEAERVVAKFGRSSVNTIEVLDGLKEGDKVIISDTSSADNAYRIHLTDQMHLLKH